jgi:hypothetical protein
MAFVAMCVHCGAEVAPPSGSGMPILDGNR